MKAAGAAKQDYNTHIKPNAGISTFSYSNKDKDKNALVENEVKCLEYELPNGAALKPLLIVLSHYFDVTENDKGLRKVKETPLDNKNNQQPQEKEVSVSNIALKIKFTVGQFPFEVVLMPARERQIFMIFSSKRFDKDQPHSYDRLIKILDNVQNKREVAKIVLDVIEAKAGGNGKNF